MRSDPVIFLNTHVKSYFFNRQKIDISYLEKINDLAGKLKDKSANEEIFLPYLIIQNLKNLVNKGGYRKVIL